MFTTFRLKSLDGGELSYVDLDILKDKDTRTRNYSHASSEDSGYFEKCWDNPVRMYNIFILNMYTESVFSRFNYWLKK